MEKLGQTFDKIGGYLASLPIEVLVRANKPVIITSPVPSQLPRPDLFVVGSPIR